MAKKRPARPVARNHVGPAAAAPPTPPTPAATDAYEHTDATLALRPDVGTQAQFKKSKPAERYRYDSSLSPALDWDGQNPAREQGEALIAQVLTLADRVKAAKNDKERDAAAAAIQEAARRLKALGRPFLNWAGKAERLSFDVPTLPLFVHERLSTEAIIQTLTGHRKPGPVQGDLFGDPRHSITDQVLRAYEYRDQWTNRMVLGDSLVVMNSLLHYEGLGGQVQMIYMDPPYGIKYGSNFQPFVRRRDVKHNDDDDLTREPEMVQAYRDTWELGLHSYLTCMRDRLLLCRELLAPTGSVFVQISDENLHHVREVMDEVFGADNAIGVITFSKTTGLGGKHLPSSCDYLLWYARSVQQLKYRQLFVPRPPIEDPYERYICVETKDGQIIDLSFAQKTGEKPLPEGRILKLDNLTSQDPIESLRYPFQFNGRPYVPSARRHWSTHEEGMRRLAKANRLHPQGDSLWYKRYRTDFSFRPIVDIWTDVKTNAFGDPRYYVVQTGTSVIERCLLMTTDPSDLVLDPTCGSGTTAYVAEQWGRRWITCDVSRVPLALARQRLLTATFPWYQLKDDDRGPAGGFIYKRKQNRKGEEVGGIVPHVTLKSIANDEPPAEEVLVDRPEEASKITRVTGPFTFEATIPTVADAKAEPAGKSGPALGSADGSRMLEVLRRSPILRLEGNRTVTLHNVRPPARSLSLSAEALVDATAPGQSPSLEDAAEEAVEQSDNRLPFSRKPVAFAFGPENAAVSEKLVKQAAMEAHAKNYTHLYVIGFAIQPNARQLVDQCEAVMDIPATYVQATPDLLMGDLLKNMRSSQIFSVCGLPEVEVRKLKKDDKYEVELLGLDVFDPTTMETQHRDGNDVPAWFLDTDYNDLCFHVSQAFFPRTGAWESLKKALKGDYSESVWDHLSGTVSAPFEPGDHKQIAVKVIDDRGNELVVVRPLGEAKR